MPSGAGDQFKFPEPQSLTHSIVPVLLRITRERIFCHIPDPSSPSSSAGCHILLCWSHGQEPCRETRLTSSLPLHQPWDGSSGVSTQLHLELRLQGPSRSSLSLSAAQTLQEKLPWKRQLQQRAGSRTRLEGWGKQSHCLDWDVAQVTQVTQPPGRGGRQTRLMSCVLNGPRANPDCCSCRGLGHCPALPVPPLRDPPGESEPCKGGWLHC